MRKSLLSIVLAFTILLTSCNNNSKDPQIALTQFLDAVAKKDFIAAKSLSTEESKPVLDLLNKITGIDSTSNELNKYDQSKLEFEKAVIDGDHATIAAKMKGSEDRMNFSLMNTKDEWKVVFDMSFIMGAALDKLDLHKSTTDKPTKDFSEIKEKIKNKIADKKEIVPLNIKSENKSIINKSEMLNERADIKNAKIEAKPSNQTIIDARESKMRAMEGVRERVTSPSPKKIN